MQPDTQTQRVLELVRHKGMLRPMDLNEAGVARMILAERVTGTHRKTIRSYVKRIDAHKTNSSGVANSIDATNLRHIFSFDVNMEHT